MKKHFLFAALLAALTPALAQPSPAGSPPAPTAPKATFVEPSAPEAAEIRRMGDSAMNWLSFTLINELNAAIAKGGIENAVEIAHLVRLPTAGDRLADLPQIKAVKLTSFRLRTPANAPDAADQLALDRVQHELTSSPSPSQVLVLRLDSPGGAPEWRVYRPIGVAPICVRCHGDPADQSPELRAKLRERYPVDNAAGYDVGQWRGLMRVTVDPTPPPPPPAKPAAKPIVKPAAKKS